MKMAVAPQKVYPFSLEVLFVFSEEKKRWSSSNNRKKEKILKSNLQ